MELHEKIRSIRKLKGWSQEEIAAKLEMSSNGYGSIERGGTDVNLSRLISIAELFVTRRGYESAKIRMNYINQ